MSGYGLRDHIAGIDTKHPVSSVAHGDGATRGRCLGDAISLGVFGFGLNSATFFVSIYRIYHEVVLNEFFLLKLPQIRGATSYVVIDSSTRVLLVRGIHVFRHQNGRLASEVWVIR